MSTDAGLLVGNALLHLGLSAHSIPSIIRYFWRGWRLRLVFLEQLFVGSRSTWRAELSLWRREKSSPPLVRFSTSPARLGAPPVAHFGLHRSGSCYCRPAERYTSRVLAWYSASSVYRWHVRTSEIDCGAEERWTHLLLPAETADWFTENRVKLNIDEISWSATPST